MVKNTANPLKIKNKLSKSNNDNNEKVQNCIY